MIYLALGAGLLWFLLWLQGTNPILKYPQWRIGSGMMGLGLFALAAFLAVRGEGLIALIPLVLGLCLTAVTRLPRTGAKPSPAPVADRISIAEAYAILDLKPGCTREDVQAAYTRLIKVVHPDKGGGAGLAAKLNAARDRLLKG